MSGIGFTTFDLRYSDVQVGVNNGNPSAQWRKIAVVS